MNKPLVLVVEDDTPVRNLITTTLKNSRIQVSFGAKRRKRRDGGAVSQSRYCAA